MRLRAAVEGDEEAPSCGVNAWREGAQAQGFALGKKSCSPPIL